MSLCEQKPGVGIPTGLFLPLGPPSSAVGADHFSVCPFRELRALVIEMVLATDMSCHFQQVKSMKTALQQLERWHLVGCGWGWARGRPLQTGGVHMGNWHGKDSPGSRRLNVSLYA